MDFETWMKQVNKIVESKVIVSTDDLPDWHWADAFMDGATPKEAVAEFFEDEGMEELL